MSSTCNGCAEYDACDRVGRECNQRCLAYRPGLRKDFDIKRAMLKEVLRMIEVGFAGEIPTGDPLVDAAWNAFRSRVRDAAQEARTALSSGD